MAGGLPILATIGKVQNTVALVVSDVKSILAMFGPPQWGLFVKGFPVLQPDSILEVDVKADWRISDFPQEAGAFQSYNKVREAKEIRVTMAKGSGASQKLLSGVLGSLVSKADGVKTFLTALETVAGSLGLYDVVTPSATYHNMNIIHFDYRRSAESGASLLTAEVWLREVKVVPPAQFSNAPQQPSGASTANTGQVQAAAPAQGANLPAAPVDPMSPSAGTSIT